MRSVFTIGLALAATTAALVHCSASGDDNGAAPGNETEAGTAETSTDATTAPDTDDDAGGNDAGDAGKAHCSPDHWCREPLPSPDLVLSAVWSFAPDDAFAVGDSGMIHWDGKTWSLVPGGDGGLEGLTGLWASGPNDIWAVASGQHRLLHGTRASGGSISWTTLETDGGPTRDHVTGTAPGDVWTAGVEDDGTQVLEHAVSVDGGAPTFSKLVIPDSPFFTNGLFVSAGDELWIAGSGDAAAVVLHAKKKANVYAWDTSLDTTGQPFTFFPAIWGDSANEIWVLGAKADHYHRSALADGGGAWSPIANHVSVAMTSVWGSGKNDVWAVGYFGAIRHWDGSAWTVSQIAVNGTPIYQMLASVHGSSATDVWAVGAGVALHRTIGGEP
ncbi:MAG: hypothetical protein JWO86_1042 [Myxococcaceae bacterium]|nr:hypothetical protein [Myxococcaceae bacterium]